MQKRDIECRILNDPLEIFQDLKSHGYNYRNIVGIICDDNVNLYDTGPNIIADAIKEHLRKDKEVVLAILSGTPPAIEHRPPGFEIAISKPMPAKELGNLLADINKKFPRTNVTTTVTMQSTSSLISPLSTGAILSKLTQQPKLTAAGNLSVLNSSPSATNQQLGQMSEMTDQSTEAVPVPTSSQSVKIAPTLPPTKTGLGRTR